MQMGFKRLKENAVERRADEKVIKAIKKVAAANKIAALIAKWRVDRDAYLLWKAKYLKDKQQQIGA